MKHKNLILAVILTIIMLLGFSNIFGQCKVPLEEHTQFTVTKNNISCKGLKNGSLNITLNATNANFDRYIFSLANSQTGEVLETSPELADLEYSFSNLKKGTYTAKVTGITFQPSTPKLEISNNTPCNDAGNVSIKDYDNSFTYSFFKEGEQINTLNVVNGEIIGFLEDTEYAITKIKNGCASIPNSFIVKKEEPKPVPKPTINVSSNCESRTITLKAEDYTGELFWSTGENSPEITINNEGSYTLMQTINCTSSPIASISIPANAFAFGMPTNVNAIPSIINSASGETAELVAEGCDNSSLHWYSDKALTTELNTTTVSPETTTTYYVVCKNQFGCVSEAIQITVTVDNFNL